MTRRLFALLFVAADAAAQIHVEPVPTLPGGSLISGAAGAVLRALPSVGAPLGLDVPLKLGAAPTTVVLPAAARSLRFTARPLAGARARGTGASERGLLARIVAWNFDWDDNIFFMPTKIVLVDKRTGATREVTTGDYAKIRSSLGTPGEWEHFSTDPDSFRYFGGKYFLQHIREAVLSGDTSWQGPSWKAFVEACSRPQTALHTTIITARSASPEDMLAGLRFLQEQGYLKHLPPLENLYGVGAAHAANPSAAKAEVMRIILDRIQAVPLGDDAPPVVSQDGQSRRPLHLWGFSDDDWGNFSTALEFLSAAVRAGRYGNVKITVFYTGTNTPEHPPGAWIIRPDGVARPSTPIERTESLAGHLEK